MMTASLSILKTWYIHNRFLTPDDIADLENETDPYFRDVYTFGKWGVLGDVIFKNWEVRDLSDLIPTFDNLRFGLDFGFSSDPAALVCSHYDKARKTIYIFNEFYERGLTNDMLADGIRPFVNYRRIIGDSSEPKSIQELRNSGIDAIGARKGPDSIMHGIQWLQQHTIIIDSRCINTRNEFQQYQWQRDKDGNAIRRPVDKNNHIIDALRYAYEDDSAGSLEAGATSYV
jgi:phage terminase large subunit